MNAAQVRSKARMAMKRREEEIEAEEIEGGEINLIPYLDIVTNLMLFLLASISAGVILGQLNTTLPDQASSTQTDVQPGDPDDKPLNLVVTMSNDKIQLFSATEVERGPQDPWVFRRTHPGSSTEGEYAELNQTLYDIAARRWRGEIRKLPTYQIILVPDPGIPYGDIIRVMDAMRCKLPDPGEAPNPCYFPEESMEKADAPVSELQRLYDPKRKQYDPDTDALFNQIVFSSGF